MPTKQRMSDFRAQNSHITIEEATQQGLWKIVSQLKKDKKTRIVMGLPPLQESIDSTPLKPGRPKKYK